MPLTALKPSPDFTNVAAASRAWARKVTDPEELPKVIEQALRVVRENRRVALLDVRVLPD